MFPALVTTGCHRHGSWVKKAEGNLDRSQVGLPRLLGRSASDTSLAKWEAEEEEEGMATRRGPRCPAWVAVESCSHTGTRGSGEDSTVLESNSDNEAGKGLQTGALSLGSIFLTRKKLVGLNVDHKLPTTPCCIQPFPKFEISELGNFLINFIN